MLGEKRVVVTGASSGIGRAIALACARAGADVATTYRSNLPGAESVAQEVRQLGRRALVAPADIAREEDLERFTGVLRAEFGGVDVWINSAGADILTGANARLSRLQKLDLLLAVDLRGTMLGSWTAAGLMAEGGGGVIINMSWDGVLQGLGGENPALFAAVKGGVLSFSRALARSLAPAIRVNILGPGWIETAFGANASPEFREKVRRRIPLGRWGTPDDVAGVAVFLASDAARYLTGQLIMVNGGEIM
jgi:3-oxoacyl-[acyl-carrier protein] reductase